MAAEAEARFSSQVAPENGENYTTTKIGDFILKVRRSESEGNK
jgi:hypothetical protein